MQKKSYPNFDEYISRKPTYDLSKWIKAAQDIYLKVNYGFSRDNATKSIISAWPETEQFDFKNWLKYYESKDYLKYKTAQHNFYMSEDVPGYFLPNPKIPSPIKSIDTHKADDMSFIPTNQPPAENKQLIIEEQRRRIIGRLNSVEKLLTSKDGHIFAGDEFDALLNSIYELKKQIQKVNKKSFANTIYNDMIVRQANMLLKKGYEKSSEILIKIAQHTPGAYNANQGPLPLGDKIDGTGTLENPTPALKDLGKKPEDIEVSDEKDKKEDQKDKKKDEKAFEGMQGFLDNLSTFGLTDINEVEDIEIDAAADNDGFIVLSQDAAVNNVPQQKENVEIKNIQQNQEGKDNFDKLLDAAFSNITISDVIGKLEEVNAIFKKREIARQLAIIDIMLNKLGLSTYFGDLSEAQNRNLDATQYCQIRIDNILSKLKGAMESKQIDLNPDDVEISNPEIQKIKQNLDSSQKIEKERKEMRQKLRDQEVGSKLEGKEKPEVEIKEELPETPAKIKPPTTPAPTTQKPIG